MADNINVTQGTGTIVATDDVSGVHFQKVKVDLGGNGLSAPLSFGQQTAAGSMPVVLASEQETVLDNIETHVGNVEGELTTLNAVDFATQTTLAAILAKIIAAPSTSAKQDTIIGHVDGIESALSTLNAKDFATQTTLAAILAKIIAAPATEAKQDTIIGHVDGIESAFTTLNAKDFATQTTLAAILAKIIAAPATEAKQDDIIEKQDEIIGHIDGIDTGFSTTHTKLDTLHADLDRTGYESVVASQTNQTMGATGASGDILERVVIIPATTSPGAVSIKDGSNSAITIFAGGTDSVATLSPIFVTLGMKSASGAWQITTGADVSAIGIGRFTA